MKQAIVRFFGLAVALFLATSALAQGTAAGDWELNVESPQGSQTVTLTIKLDGEKATGSLTSMIGSMPITGTVAGGKLDVSGNLEAQGMALTLALSGTIAGDTVNGSMKVGEFGEYLFSGKRASSATSTSAPAPAPAASGAPAASTASGVAGRWNVTLMLEGMGEFPATADLTQDGENVAGTFSSMAGEVAVKGTFAGSALKLEFTAETPQGPLTVTMTGDLGSEGLAGKASIAGLGEADWKAVRAQ